jgi:hypothetical protein
MRAIKPFSIGLITIATVAVAVAIEIGSKKRGTPEAQTQAQELTLRALQKLKMETKWNRIEVEEAIHNHYRLTLAYRNQPADLAEAELDTKTVARSVLSELIAAGVNPRKQFVSLSVWARRSIPGDTGPTPIENYGHAYYDFDRDQLEFQPP